MELILALLKLAAALVITIFILFTLIVIYAIFKSMKEYKPGVSDEEKHK